MKSQDKSITTHSIRIAGEQDAAELTALCRKTFFEAYGADNTTENMQQYLDAHFTESLILKELANPATWVFVSEAEGRLTGYLALKKADPPVPPATQNAAEISRFYVDRNFQGTKVGADLMRTCLDWARQHGFESVWLAVWKKNLKAVAIYEHYGFEISGETTFKLGDDVQTDHVMVKHL